jgi:hypothetical protein
LENKLRLSLLPFLWITILPLISRAQHPLPSKSQQTDPWVGTWQLERKPIGGQPATLFLLQIGEPERGLLYPARLHLDYGKFSGEYHLLLAWKNEHQLGVGRNKIPLSEKPFPLGPWMAYINGTLNSTPRGLVLKRMRIDRKDWWMRGMASGGMDGGPINTDDELWEAPKAAIRSFLFSDSILLKKTNNLPWKDTSIQAILHPEGRGIYYGLMSRINTPASFVTISIGDNERIDQDTVTLLHNGRMVLDRVEVNTNAHLLHIPLDTGLNIFSFFADNYGKRPPNTGNLHVIIDSSYIDYSFDDRSNAFAGFIVAQLCRQPATSLNQDTSQLSTLLTQRSSVRKTDTLPTIQVRDSLLTLELWDSQIEDGDRISIRLNGTWILSGFPVLNKLQKVPVKLIRGENRLLFMADNLGSIPPNTADLRIRYGRESKTLKLETDLKKNNEIRILYE